MVATPMAGLERTTDTEDAAEKGQAMPEPFGRAPFGHDRPSAPRRRRRKGAALLARTLESDIIPRLLLAHRQVTAPGYLDHGATTDPRPQDVAAVAGLAMRADLPGLLSYVEGLRARGLPMDRLYLELFAPAARRLGEMWEEDDCDFTAVTIGLSCLHQAVREFNPSFVARAPRAEPERRILLATTPGEQHSFGILVVEQFFRGAGWDVWSGANADRAEILEAAHRIWFGVAGFSLACEAHIGTLAMLIRDVRRASCNAGIGILVGGPLFLEHPELVSLVGADASAGDGRQATLQAETMLALLGRQA